MAIARYIQSPDEVKAYKIDYINWLDRDGLVAESISSVAASAGPVTDPVIVATGVVLVSQTGVSITIQGGVIDTDYTVKVQVTTSSGQVKEDCIEISLRAACV